MSFNVDYEYVKRNHRDFTAKDIREGAVKFHVIEEGTSTPITICVERIDGTFYLGAGKYETVNFIYSVIESPHKDLLYYTDETAEDFVESYLSNCEYVCLHWTVNA